MTDPASAQKPDRPALPRDAFRTHRVSAAAPDALAAKPVVVTPAYQDHVTAPVAPAQTDSSSVRKQPRPQKARDRNPFDVYGERSSSRPYALRFPDAIDLVVRQMAAEERTHPLRIIDRIVYDHLKRIGRLPPSRET